MWAIGAQEVKDVPCCGNEYYLVEKGPQKKNGRKGL